MSRAHYALLFTVLVGTSANAASLAVAPDKLTYNIGETITLTITGDDAGATAYSIYGRLLYSGALVDNGTRSQVAIVDDSGPWVKSVLNEGDDGVEAYSDAISQLTINAGTALNLPGTLSTVTLIAKAMGVVNVNWNTTIPNQLDFFGLTDAPGTSFEIVPEPATAFLLGLGLIAIAAAQRCRE
jgi:hypothetical protein